ncbi:MAG: hypothetical protein JXB29_02005 [Sedimentisphaerales bacterium]|nr:hypothetical protein [Sedimentisphaerales bacterium]
MAQQMSSKQRMLTAIEGKVPDRLPVTTHHIMPYFLKKYMAGITNDEFFDYFGLDPIHWMCPRIPDEKRNEYCHPDLGCYVICSDNWQVKAEEISETQYKTVRYTIVTPKGNLSLVLQSNEMTTWVSEYLVKNKSDIDIISEFMTMPVCDISAVNKTAAEFGQKGLVRGHICGFTLFGQPGCWQDACCLAGTEKMIMATYDDPKWVHEFLHIMQRRKVPFVQSLKGANFDILELGGGDASTTVISPKIFNDFVAPYDSELVRLAHQAGQKIAYHTCGGMMPILEDIAAMDVDAMETFTPPDMGGDTDLAQAKERIGQKVCMIGGFDQFHHFLNCSEEETRAAVRRCFEQAGENGGFIISPSDHFFDAEPELIKAYADQARQCTY